MKRKMFLSEHAGRKARTSKRERSTRGPRARPLILTVGHSNHTIGEFLELLKAHGLERLVDVRTIPRSRHNPQFNRDALAASVRRAHIAYTHLPKLGGLRHARRDSVNAGWQNASFRGYADYMQSREFAAALARLEKLAAHKRCAMMCAEAVPWRCHRSLVADALTVRGYPVEHIMTPARANRHKLTPFARVRGKCVTYPPNRATRAYAAKKRAAASRS